MIEALVGTPAGLVGLTLASVEPIAMGLAGMATAVYGAGGICWIVSLPLRLTVVPWAAKRATAGQVPEGFAAYNQWAGALYVANMLTAYVGSAVLGMAVLASAALPAWLGWAGVSWGLAFAAGIISDPFRRAVQFTILSPPVHGNRRVGPSARLNSQDRDARLAADPARVGAAARPSVRT